MAVQVIRNVSENKKIIIKYLYKEPAWILSLLALLLTCHSITTPINLRQILVEYRYSLV